MVLPSHRFLGPYPKKKTRPAVQKVFLSGQTKTNIIDIINIIINLLIVVNIIEKVDLVPRCLAFLGGSCIRQVSKKRPLVAWFFCVWTVFPPMFPFPRSTSAPNDPNTKKKHGDFFFGTPRNRKLLHFFFGKYVLQFLNTKKQRFLKTPKSQRTWRVLSEARIGTFGLQLDLPVFERSWAFSGKKWP